jgi:hypothetical protein
MIDEDGSHKNVPITNEKIVVRARRIEAKTHHLGASPSEQVRHIH